MKPGASFLPLKLVILAIYDIICIKFIQLQGVLMNFRTTTISAITGYVLYTMRIEAKFTKLKPFAEMIGLAHTSYAKLEKGETATTVEFLYTIATIFGTRPSLILGQVERLLEILTTEHNVAILSNADIYQEKSHIELKELALTHDDFESLLSFDQMLDIKRLVSKKVTAEELHKIELEYEKRQQEILNNSQNATLAWLGGGSLAAGGGGMAAGMMIGSVSTILAAPLGAVGIAGFMLIKSLRDKKKAP